MMSLRVMVVGAGIGGLTLANGLSQAGVEVVVYERDPNPEVHAQGARVHIDDRGTRALQECLSPQQFDFCRATFGQPSENVCEIGEVNGGLEILTRHKFSGAEGAPQGVRPGWPASRRLLRRLLLSGVESKVRFGKQLLRYEIPSGGGVCAHFADGSTEHGDVLVGADGIGSAVRSQYLPHAQVVDTGMRWLGGKTPVTAEIAATGLLDMIEGSFTIYSTGDQGMFIGMMRFQEPPLTAAARLLPHLDPGDTTDYVMWAAAPSQEKINQFGITIDTASTAELWSLAKILTNAAHPDLQLIVNQAWAEQTYWLQVGMAVPVQPWSPSAVTLLGDAIHAMPPVRGAGVNTALQDAHRLVTNLIAVHRGELELLPAIGNHEDQMRRDGYEAVTASSIAASSLARNHVSVARFFQTAE